MRRHRDERFRKRPGITPLLETERGTPRQSLVPNALRGNAVLDAPRRLRAPAPKSVDPGTNARPLVPTFCVATSAVPLRGAPAPNWNRKLIPDLFLSNTGSSAQSVQAKRLSETMCRSQAHQPRHSAQKITPPIATNTTGRNHLSRNR